MSDQTENLAKKQIQYKFLDLPWLRSRCELPYQKSIKRVPQIQTRPILLVRGGIGVTQDLCLSQLNTQITRYHLTSCKKGAIAFFQYHAEKCEPYLKRREEVVFKTIHFSNISETNAYFYASLIIIQPSAVVTRK